MTTTKETIVNISIVTITNPDQEFLRYIFDGDSKTLTITGDSLNVIVTDISSIEDFYNHCNDVDYIGNRIRTNDRLTTLKSINNKMYDKFLQKRLSINENSLAYPVIEDLIDYVNDYFERNDCFPNELDLLDDCEDLHEELSNLVEKNDGFVSDLFDTPKLRVDLAGALYHVLDSFRDNYQLERNA